MLVLSRKSRQSIVIEEDVVIHFTQIRGGSVRVVIDAPKDVTIRRGELLSQWQDDHNYSTAKS